MTGEELLEQHDISKPFAEQEGITWDEDYLHLPMKDHEGKTIWTKSRNLHHGEEGHPLAKESKYKNPAGIKTNTLFNWHRVKDKPSIVFCEGQLDALKLTEEGIPAISFSGGAGTFNNEWVELLKDKNLWFCFDADNTGREATRKGFDLFPNAKAIELPEVDHLDICGYFALGCTKKDFLKLEALESAEWKKKHRPPEYNLISAKQFSTMEIEKHPWLIENIVYSEGFCFIYGAEGTGKSYLALSIANAIANGEPWLDKFPTTKGNVLFLDKENPKSMIQKRLKGLGAAQPNIYWLEYPEKFQLTDFNGEASAFAKELSQIIIEREIDLIIIDSFVDLVAGSENSAADTQAFFSGLRELYPNIAYLVLHHENKPSQGVSRSASQRLRGSSNINAQTFTMFRLEPVAKSKTEMTLLQTKARDSQKLSKFMIRMKIKPTLDGGTTVTRFEYMGEVEDAIDNSKLSEVQENIKNLVEEKKFVTRPEVLAAGFGTETTVDRALKSLVGSGVLAVKKKNRKNVYAFDIFSQEDFDETLDDLSTPIV